MSDDGVRVRCKILRGDLLLNTSNEATLHVDEDEGPPPSEDWVYGSFGGDHGEGPSRAMLAQPWSVTFSCYFVNTPSNMQLVTHGSNFNTGALANYWRVNILGAGNLRVQLWENEDFQRTATIQVPPPVGEWIDVEAGWTGSQLYCRAFGEEAITDISTMYLGPTESVYRVLNTGGNILGVQIRDIVIREDNNSFLVRWQCNEGSGVQMLDSSGGNFTGTLTSEDIHEIART